MSIPSSVTYIGDGGFGGCSSLTSVNIPSSVTFIGDGAFGGCSSLTSVNIPSSITFIGDGAFGRCENLTSITINSQNPAYSSLEGVLYNKKRTVLIQYPGGKQERTYTIPSGVTSIGDGAFQECSRLTSITIPSSVTSIEARAFSECSSLTSVNIPSSVTFIGNSAFEDCKSLTNITIGANIDMYDFSFENNFNDYYNAQGRRAGTYTYRNGSWSVR